ncbi:hypothetical protein BH23CHL7_BH23CHL7_06860 [soil metagenome]
MTDEELELLLRRWYRARSERYPEAPPALRMTLANLPAASPNDGVRWLPAALRRRPLNTFASVMLAGALGVVGVIVTLALLGGPSTEVGGQSPSPSPTAFGSPSPAPSESPLSAGWTFTGSMNVARHDHEAVLLADGRVLVVGGNAQTPDGSAGGSLASAELYDPSDGTWTRVADMSEVRAWHTVTQLNDGRVLVAGGGNQSRASAAATASAEIFDPTTGRWSATPSMSVPRTGHTAALLDDGTVLVVGGGQDRNRWATAEIYDPVSDSWRPAASMANGRWHHAAVMLNDGILLVAGGIEPGSAEKSAELYDPLTNTWRDAADMPTGRGAASATLLQDGTVLLTGGMRRLERYDPRSDTWSPVQGAGICWDSRALLMPDGRVMDMCSAQTDLYDPDSAMWTAGPDWNVGRHNPTTTLLADGRVLVAGGIGKVNPIVDASLTSAEILDSRQLP